MKTIVIMFSFFSLFAVTNTSAQTTVLDGKTYAVQTEDKTDLGLTTPETIVFEDGKANAPICSQYGFGPAPYKAVTAKNGDVNFRFTSVSIDEGELLFSGTINDDVIEGTYVWRKPGRKDLRYKFEGKLN